MRRSDDNELSYFDIWCDTIFLYIQMWSVAVSCCSSSDRNIYRLLHKPTHNSVTFQSSLVSPIMSSFNAEISAESFTNQPIIESPFNLPHSSGQSCLSLKHKHLLTSSQTNSQFSCLLTPVPLTYNFPSSDTEQIKQTLDVKKITAMPFRKMQGYLEKLTHLSWNITWISQAAALVPQVRFTVISLPRIMQSEPVRNLHLNSQAVRVLCTLPNM